MSKYGEFFVIAKQLPHFDDGARATLVFGVSNGRTSSLSELTSGEYDSLMDNMKKLLGKVNANKRNKWSEGNISNCRKLVIAAIGGYFRLTDREESLNTIIATACRHARSNSFNVIPAEELRRIYNTFTAKQRDCHKAIRKAELHNNLNDN